jgi:putative DNA primase/helicase
VWLCAPLRITARTRADDANGWGLLLEFNDLDGNAKTWAMPAALLSGEGAEWAARLRDMGLDMAHGTAAQPGGPVHQQPVPPRAGDLHRPAWAGTRRGVRAALPLHRRGRGRRYVFQASRHG